MTRLPWVVHEPRPRTNHLAVCGVFMEHPLMRAGPATGKATCKRCLRSMRKEARVAVPAALDGEV